MQSADKVVFPLFYSLYFTKMDKIKFYFDDTDDFATEPLEEEKPDEDENSTDDDNDTNDDKDDKKEEQEEVSTFQ